MIDDARAVGTGVSSAGGLPTRAVAPDALAKHGGRVASVTPKPSRLEGDMEVPGALALLEFPNPEAAHAWHEDAELATAHELRRAGADFSIFVTAALG